MTWRQGDHLLLLGATGTGKTTVEQALLEYRKAVVVLVTKDDDINWRGYRTVKRASDVDIRKCLKWRLYPDYEHAPREFAAMLDRAWLEGCWCICIDEYFHVQDMQYSPKPKVNIKLQQLAEKLLTQGRSKKITIVGGSQRPAWVTKFAFSESRYVVCFRLGLGEDLDKVRKNFGKPFADRVSGLGRFEYAWLDKVSGQTGVGSSKSLGEVFA